MQGVALIMNLNFSYSVAKKSHIHVYDLQFGHTFPKNVKIEVCECKHYKLCHVTVSKECLFGQLHLTRTEPDKSFSCLLKT